MASAILRSSSRILGNCQRSEAGGHAAAATGAREYSRSSPPSRSLQVIGPEVQNRIGACDRRLQPKSSVRTSSVVVFQPRGQNAPEVALVEDQDPVPALAPSRTDLPLHVRIRLGGRDWRPNHLDAF